MIRRTVPAVSAALVGLVAVAACTGNEATSDAAGSTTTQTSATANGCGSAAPQILFGGSRSKLEAGCYQLSFYANPGVETPKALIEIPSGYENDTAWYVVSHDGGEFLGLWTVGQVDRDACLHGERDSFDPGPSVQDMAEALVAQQSTRATEPMPVTLAGHDGLYVEINSPRDYSTCDDPEAALWYDPGGRCICNGGQVDRVWILDVDGQRLVVDAAYSGKSTVSERDDLSSMVESLEFVGTADD